MARPVPRSPGPRGVYLVLEALDDRSAMNCSRSDFAALAALPSQKATTAKMMARTTRPAALPRRF